MNWRDLIHQYLAACAIDDRNKSMIERSGACYQFLENYGSEQFKQLEKERLQSNLNRTEEPLSSPESYAIIHEQSDLIIVEVQPGPNGKPYMLTRYRLIRNHGQWHLDDYLWQCQCSNGECGWCGGTGVCEVCHGEGQCKFCQDELVCQLCKGARTCGICRDSDMPGWNSMTRKR